MKVVILAGGLGSRLAEETDVLPKPMVGIGGRPILWHILKHYRHHGFREFTVALGYKGDVIKRYFLEYRAIASDVTVDVASGRHDTHGSSGEDWSVHLVDTGLETQTGGRLKRLAPGLSRETFMVTYGDGVSNVDLGALLAFHRKHGRLATVTAVRPPARFGRLDLDGDRVAHFAEKPQMGEGWINGGYLVLEPKFLEYLEKDSDTLEIDGLEAAAKDRQLMAFRHEGFWQCMDTVRDRRQLEGLWQGGKAAWKVWA